MEESKNPATPAVDMDKLKATGQGLMRKGYIKWGLYAAGVLFVMGFINMIPIIGCLTTIVTCFLAPAIYTYAAFRGAQDSVKSEGISSPQTMDHIKFGIFTAGVAVIGAIIGNIITTILRFALNIAAISSSTSMLGGTAESWNTVGATASIGAASIIMGIIMGTVIGLIVAAIFGAVGGFIADWMYKKDQVPAAPAAPAN